MKIKTHVSGLQSRRIQQVIDQFTQVPGFTVDDLEKIMFGFFIPIGIFTQQGSGVTPDEPERIAQLVSDGANEVILQVRGSTQTVELFFVIINCFLADQIGNLKAQKFCEFLTAGFEFRSAKTDEDKHSSDFTRDLQRHPE